MVISLSSCTSWSPTCIDNSTMFSLTVSKLSILLCCSPSMVNLAPVQYTFVPDLYACVSVWLCVCMSVYIVVYVMVVKKHSNQTQNHICKTFTHSTVVQPSNYKINVKCTSCTSLCLLASISCSLSSISCCFLLFASFCLAAFRFWSVNILH